MLVSEIRGPVASQQKVYLFEKHNNSSICFDTVVMWQSPDLWTTFKRSVGNSNTEMQHDLTSYVNLTGSACTACFIGPNVCQADILNHFLQVSAVLDHSNMGHKTTWMTGCIIEDKRDCHNCAIKMWKLSDKRLLFWLGVCGRYDDMVVMIIRNNEAELRC